MEPRIEAAAQVPRLDLIQNRRVLESPFGAMDTVTERPGIGYAMIFPSMAIVKVIAVQIVGLLVAAGPSVAG